MDAASIINPLISAAAGLLGVVVGSYGTDRREREKRKADYINRQLTELYGPMLGLRAATAAHGEVRGKLDSARDPSWVELLNQAAQSGGVDAVPGLMAGPLGQKIMENRMIDFDYENQRFRETLFPLYQKMAQTFCNNISLSEPETRQHFPALVEYVEVCDRILQGKLPVQVMQNLGQHTEVNLFPLYDNIRETHDRLRAQLGSAKNISGRSWTLRELSWSLFSRYASRRSDSLAPETQRQKL